ncbi:hypothetical protein FOL46_003570, partial [Perkinsus olseni]
MSMFSYTGFFVALIALFLAGCSSDSTSTAAPTSAPEVATTGSSDNHFMASTTANDFDDDTTPSSGKGGNDDMYCSGKPAGEYCGKINGEMARILIEEHVFYFNYESKVNLKNVPFHIYDCKEFEPDYEAMES